jgi:ribosomal protein L40E
VAKSSEVKKMTESLPDEKTTVCPMCGTNVPEDAEECPKCEEPFTPEAVEKKVKKEFEINKWRFWAGVILVLIGGPGIALGSYLHDVLRIRIGEYDAFDTFGWVNSLVSVVGIIILVVGIILLILSLPKVSTTEPKDEEIGESDVTGDQGG